MIPFFHEKRPHHIHHSFIDTPHSHLLFMMFSIRNMPILRSHELFFRFSCIHHCYPVWTGLLSCCWCDHSSKLGRKVAVVNVVKNLQVVVRKRATTSAHQAGAHPLTCPHALWLITFLVFTCLTQHPKSLHTSSGLYTTTPINVYTTNRNIH